MIPAHRESPAPSARIDVKVGFACNNHCLFCVQGDKRARFAPRSAEELRSLLGRERSRADSVVFTGGEPTVRKDLPELVACAKALGYRTIQIQSNGRMFAHASFVQRLVQAGANEFSPALHGHTAALHDYLTSAPGSFAQTVAGIRNLKAAGQFVLTNSVVTRSSYRHLPELARLLLGLGVDQFQFAFVHPVGTAGDLFDQVVPRMELAAPYLKAALQVGIDAGRRAFTEAVPYCILRGYESCVVEKAIPRTAVFDAQTTIEDYTRYRLDEGKLKGPNCPGCVYFSDCEGPWREYPERLGWSEFQPVRSRPGPGGELPP